MQSLFLSVEEAKTVFALAPSVFVLAAVNCIGLALKEINPQTVGKCFNKVGFGGQDQNTTVTIKPQEKVAANAELIKM